MDRAGEHPPPIPNPASDAVSAFCEAADESIFCPICNYNLTGVLSGRCPECGSLFDRESFLQTQRTHGVMLIPWDDPKIKSLRERWKGTLSICMVQPDRFGKAFSIQRADTRAWPFMRLVLLITTIASCSAFLIAAPFCTFVGGFEWWSLLLLIFFFLTTATVSFTVLAGIVLWLFCTHYDGKRHLRPWLAIAAYSSAHSLLTLPIVFIVPLAILLRNSFDPEFLLLGMILILHYGGLWLTAFTLRGVVKHRTAKHRQTFLVPASLILLVNVVTPGCWIGSAILVDVINKYVRLFQSYP